MRNTFAQQATDLALFVGEMRQPGEVRNGSGGLNPEKLLQLHGELRVEETPALRHQVLEQVACLVVKGHTASLEVEFHACAAFVRILQLIDNRRQLG
ncbi:MAG TPA: hypothetical protein VJ063_08145, partial [Verrucomicrobiae bacterium]|nr:hypothetical protein [Verrucomicrobiae bacterium]